MEARGRKVQIDDVGVTLLIKETPASSSSSNSSSSRTNVDTSTKTGTAWTATAHIMTAVIGSGVLSMGWSVGQLGWIGGPITLFFFAAVTLTQSHLMADCYQLHDPTRGIVIHPSYMDAVQSTLGQKSQWFCALFVQLSLYGCGIVYTIASSTSMMAIKGADCNHKEGRDAPCMFGHNFYMLLFGVTQILLSQIPNFNHMAWLSVFAAFMSFSYTSIGFALCLTKVIANKNIKGSIWGIAVASTSQKMWRVSQALGDIASAYPYSQIIFEIQNSLMPPENVRMKQATTMSVCITTFMYVCCSFSGYAAFGDDTPGNLLTGFGFYEPHWLIDFANLCIVLHLLGGYQVISQPLFGMAERWLTNTFPADNTFIHKTRVIKLPTTITGRSFQLNLLRLCFRTLYVISTTSAAMALPYFNQVMGLLGAFNFWPLAIYLPVEMYIVHKKVKPWTTTWVALRLFSVVCLVVSAFAFLGSGEGVFIERSS